MRRILFLLVLCSIAVKGVSQNNISEIQQKIDLEIQGLKDKAIRDSLKEQLKQVEHSYQKAYRSIILNEGSIEFVNMGTKDGNGNYLYWMIGYYKDKQGKSTFKWNDIDICEKNAFVYKDGIGNQYNLFPRVPTVQEIRLLQQYSTIEMSEEQEVHFTGRLKWGFRDRYYVSNLKGWLVESKITGNSILIPLGSYWTKTTYQQKNSHAHNFEYTSDGYGEKASEKSNVFLIQPVISFDMDSLYTKSLMTILHLAKHKKQEQSEAEKIARMRYEKEKQRSIEASPFLSLLAEVPQKIREENIFDFKTSTEREGSNISIKIKVCTNKNTSKFYSSFWKEVEKMSETITQFDDYNNGRHREIKTSPTPNNRGWDIINKYQEYILGTRGGYQDYSEIINGRSYQWWLNHFENKYRIKDNEGKEIYTLELLREIEKSAYAYILDLKILSGDNVYMIQIDGEKDSKLPDNYELVDAEGNIMGEITYIPIIPIPYSRNFKTIDHPSIGISNSKGGGIRIPFLQNKYEKGIPIYNITITITVPFQSSDEIQVISNSTNKKL